MKKLYRSRSEKNLLNTTDLSVFKNDESNALVPRISNVDLIHTNDYMPEAVHFIPT